MGAHELVMLEVSWRKLLTFTGVVLVACELLLVNVTRSRSHSGVPDPGSTTGQ